MAANTTQPVFKTMRPDEITKRMSIDKKEKKAQKLGPRELQK